MFRDNIIKSNHEYLRFGLSFFPYHFEFYSVYFRAHYSKKPRYFRIRLGTTFLDSFKFSGHFVAMSLDGLLSYLSLSFFFFFFWLVPRFTIYIFSWLKFLLKCIFRKPRCYRGSVLALFLCFCELIFCVFFHLTLNISKYLV